jgi:hypothetical protein
MMTVNTARFDTEQMHSHQFIIFQSCFVPYYKGIKAAVATAI